MWELTSKFIDSEYKIKHKYESSADNEIFLFYNGK